MTDSMDHARGCATGGVVERLADDEVERKRFLKMAGRRIGAGAAATGLAAFIAACGGSSSGSSTAGARASGSASASGSSSTTSGNASTSSGASSTGGDLGIVNYALTLEYLESQFYEKVIASGLFKGSTLSTLKTFGAEEDHHVMALKGVAMKLGKPAAKPKAKFPIKSASQVAVLAAGAVYGAGAVAPFVGNALAAGGGGTSRS